MRPVPPYGTATELLLARQDCLRHGARFLSGEGEPSFHTYQELVRRAQQVAGALQQEGLEPGDPVALVLPNSIHFFDVFWGIQLAGGVPAALYPPLRLGKLDEYFSRTRKMLEKMCARFVVTDKRLKRIIGPAVEGVECLEEALDAEDLATPAKWRPVPVDPGSTAFLQFSSGTTMAPKAVMVSHSNLMQNLRMMESVFCTLSEEETERGGVSWLPLFHDMGLVGFMFMGLYLPATVTYIRPEAFIAKPRIWLETLSRYRAVVSSAPDFAYGLCLARIQDEEMKGIDLSSWKIALNGAEPIDVEVMRRFSDRFSKWGFQPEAMTPVYGLAEAGLAVTFSDISVSPSVKEYDQKALSSEGQAIPGKGRRLASLGRPLPGIEVEIQDDNGRPLEERRVGTIMIRGASVTKGYVSDAEESTRAIRDGWLDTGDLGFFDKGELFISGRAKEIIIIRGRNYAPQEIESLLAGIDGVRKGCAVAAGLWVDGMGEQLLLLVEKDRRSERSDEEIETDIKARVVAGISLLPHRIELLAPGTLPRTSSGKMRRLDALRAYQSGELVAPKPFGMLELAKKMGRSQWSWGRFWLRKRLNAFVDTFKRRSGDSRDGQSGKS